MKILKRILLCLVFFVSIFDRKTHAHRTTENVFRLSYNRNDLTKRRMDECDDIITRLNSLSKPNRNAVMILLDSLYQQEAQDAQKEFTVHGNGYCIKYNLLTGSFRREKT